MDGCGHLFSGYSTTNARTYKKINRYSTSNEKKYILFFGYNATMMQET